VTVSGFASLSKMARTFPGVSSFSASCCVVPASLYPFLSLLDVLVENISSYIDRIQIKIGNSIIDMLSLQIIIAVQGG